MRTSWNQVLSIAVALLFTIVLTLAVTLIGFSSTRKQTETPTDPLPVNVVPGTEPATEPPSPDGLLYESLGNGCCAVAGIGSLKEAFVVIPEVSPSGERVVRISARAFYGCGQITAEEIPAGVREIGSLAFADCPNLAYVTVSGENAYFRDAEGVLYTADLRVLILYPPMRAANPAVIPRSVTSIQEMAFYGCRYLVSVLYEGSAAEWESISIGSKNYSLTAASVAFAGGEK